MNWRRALLWLPLLFALASCIDTQNVSTFATSVTVVTAATTTMIASDRSVCTNINATVAELANLPKIGAVAASANCEVLGKALDEITGINKVLENYGKALGDISQGTFINYDSDVTALQGIFKSLPANWQPTQAEAQAVSGLAGWVASLVTAQARDNAIHAAMVGENGVMSENFHTVVKLLQRLAAQYSESQATSAHTTLDVVNLVAHEYAASEPVAVAEMRIRLAGNTHVSIGQAAAIKQYLGALDAMSKAFDAATARPTAKELLGEVRDFATQAKAVYQSFTKAFPSI